MDRYGMGRFISELRRKRGLTQEALGERIGVTGKTVSRWECGTYMPDLSALEALSKIFSVSIDEIIAGKRQTSNEVITIAENAQASPAGSTSTFSANDRLRYFKRKWLRDHTADIAVHALSAAAVTVAYAVFVSAETSAVFGFFAALTVYLIDRHRMMSYAETRSFPENSKK